MGKLLKVNIGLVYTTVKIYVRMINSITYQSLLVYSMWNIRLLVQKSKQINKKIHLSGLHWSNKKWYAQASFTLESKRCTLIWFALELKKVHTGLVCTGIKKVNTGPVYTGVKKGTHMFELHWNKKKHTQVRFAPESKKVHKFQFILDLEKSAHRSGLHWGQKDAHMSSFHWSKEKFTEVHFALKWKSAHKFSLYWSQKWYTLVWFMLG